MPLKLRDVSHWTDEAIREVVYARFNLRPCIFQTKVARGIYSGKNVIACAPTGFGKTLSFWIPMLMAKAERQKRQKIILVSPLNLLAQQNVECLEQAGFRAILLTGETFSFELLKIIAKGDFDVIVSNPEMLVGNKAVRELLQKLSVASILLEIVIDEGHTIDQWADFRHHFRHIADLRYTIPGDIPIYLASATLPPDILHKVQEILNLHDDSTEYILYSNNRPDIDLMVHALAAPATSYHDLNFLIPDGMTDESPPPPKFLVFVDNTMETKKVVDHLWTRLRTKTLRNRVLWFNSTMTRQFREETIAAFRTGEVFGLCCTDAFGMGIDVPGIKIVVQLKVKVDLPALLQRFGRAARGFGERTDAILLVEKKDIVERRHAKPATKSDPAPSLVTRGPSMTAGTNPPSTSTQPPETSSKKSTFSKPQVNTEGSAIHDFINLPLGIDCRRKLQDVRCGNDQRPSSEHTLCVTLHPEGCDRCRPMSLDMCCDRCNSEYFKKYEVDYVKPKVTRRSAVKKISDDVKASKQYQDLRNNLFTWRGENAPKKLSGYMIALMGAQSFLPEPMIDRIIQCAYSQRILDADQLVKETSWRRDWAQEFAPSLVTLLLKHLPLEVPNAVDDVFDIDVDEDPTTPSIFSKEDFERLSGQAPKSPMLKKSTVPKKSIVPKKSVVQKKRVTPKEPAVPKNPTASAKSTPEDPAAAKGSIAPKKRKSVALEDITCSDCKTKGHKKGNRNCPELKQRRIAEMEAQDNKENIRVPPKPTPAPSISQAMPATLTPSSTTTPSTPTPAPTPSGLPAMLFSATSSAFAGPSSAFTPAGPSSAFTPAGPSSTSMPFNDFISRSMKAEMIDMSIPPPAPISTARHLQHLLGPTSGSIMSRTPLPNFSYSYNYHPMYQYQSQSYPPPSGQNPPS
ncbi:ATP-dependent DNA helicase Q-like 4A [Leucoagaricus sp. SymC.cos]|nr:ATP-dependent DNA helicase Q-like 4A [Leucoagaricus sp. SymC.cos]